MAKFEEADPRWKVKELGEQGRNVNNWHWTENDCFPWFKEEFGLAFEGLPPMVFCGLPLRSRPWQRAITVMIVIALTLSVSPRTGKVILSGPASQPGLDLQDRKMLRPCGAKGYPECAREHQMCDPAEKTP